MRKYDIREAIEKRRIIHFSAGPKVSFKELKTAKEDLQDAKDVLGLEKIKLATVTAYYAIFHASRELLYKKRYREKAIFSWPLPLRLFILTKGYSPKNTMITLY